MIMEPEIILQEIVVTDEPAAKKARHPQSIEKYIQDIAISLNPLRSILSDEYDETVNIVKVYVAQVKNVNETSAIIQILNEKFPLKDLSHLKRVFRKEVLLFPTSYIPSSNHACFKKFIEENLNELKDSFEYFKVTEVPGYTPKTKRQYTECGKSWSCNFHVNKYLELLISGDIFSQKEIKCHRLFMSMAFETARYYLRKTKDNLEPIDILSTELNVTVVVDSYNQSVVAVGYDNRLDHPVQHSTMVAIDNVAKTQNGGAWVEGNNIQCTHLKGIGSKELLLHLQKKYPAVDFGAREYISKNDMNKDDPKEFYPYLCTGYYVYMIREPCLMCAMALVHARAKRVFFAVNNEEGALGSKAKLQNLSSLNHRYEVFTDFL